MLESNLILNLGGATLAALVIFYCWLQPKPLQGFPHNKITSILGDIPEITQILKKGDKTLYDYYEVLVERHGPVAQLCIANQSMLLLADPSEADRVMTKSKNVEMIKFVNIIYSRLMPTGMISITTNKMWMQHRRIVGASMNHEHLSQVVHHISAAASGLVELWDAKLKLAEGKAFNAMIDLKFAMMDSIGGVALGSSLGCIESALSSIPSPTFTSDQVVQIDNQKTPPIYEAFRVLFTHFGHAPMLPIPSITFPLYTLFSPSWHSSRKLARSFIERTIKEARRRSDIEVDCVLNMLLQRERDGGEKLSQQELLDEMLLMFIGGHDATSAALFWFVKYMPSDVEIQRRLHDELCSVFGDDTIQMSLDVLKDSMKIPVLEAVIAETLRCAMIGGAIGRYLTEDTVIMGRHVPKGTEIIVPNSLMGMERSAWGPDVKLWRPARWLRSDGSFDPNAGPSGNPFGLWRRACFGERLAMIKLKVFIATLSRAFLFKPVPEEVGSMQAFTMVTRQPKLCYVMLERWE